MELEVGSAIPRPHSILHATVPDKEGEIPKHLVKVSNKINSRELMLKATEEDWKALATVDTAVSS